MKCFYIFLICLSACSTFEQQVPTNDTFDKILQVMKSKKVEELNRYFGNPNEISHSGKGDDSQILRFKDSRIDVYTEKTNKEKISHLTIFFFEESDNYTYLKKRFNKYTWIESKLKDNPKSDVATDLYLVKIPEIKMEFQYDNLASKRKVMWIYFD
jgi:hypothetical protein